MLGRKSAVIVSVESIRGRAESNLVGDGFTAIWGEANWGQYGY